MITKAFIQEVVDPHHIRIRIPLYNKIENVNGSTPNSELGIAAVCTLPNFITDARPGSVVIVGFEEDSISKPIILGYLSTNGTNASEVNIKCNDLTATGEILLTDRTTIGEVIPENILCLKNLKTNVNLKFQEIDKSVEGLKETDEKHTQAISTNSKSIAETNVRVDETNTKLDNTKKELEEAISNLIVVGDTKPTTDKVKPGQVYLWIKDPNTVVM
jgi:hypothetical protein